MDETEVLTSSVFLSNLHPHALEPTSYDRQQSAGCDICNKSGNECALYSCLNCNFDICGDCYYNNQSEGTDFRAVAIIRCGNCGYLEFPGCNDHSQLLSYASATGEMECSAQDCTVSTSMYWTQCSNCKTPNPCRYTINLRVKEIQYCRKSYPDDVNLLQTAVTICKDCNILEFPGDANQLVSINK
jgi:hypothetical protein